MFRFAQHDPGDAEGLLRQSVLLGRLCGRDATRPYQRQVPRIRLVHRLFGQNRWVAPSSGRLGVEYTSWTPNRV